MFGIHRNIAIYNLIMGVTRSDLFTETQNDLALMAKAFSHPARIAIIQHLLEAQACINSDLVQELGLSQATISQHLRELRDIGVVQGSIEGTRRNYCINAEKWESIRQQFNELFKQFSQPDSCCCR